MLSDGERQKAFIAKAMAQETPLMLLDEPSAFLDYPSKVELMQQLNRLAKEYNKDCDSIHSRPRYRLKSRPRAVVYVFRRATYHGQMQR